MRVSSVTYNILFSSYSRSCFKDLEKHILRLLTMLPRKNNSFVSKTESNAHHNDQHHGAGGSSVVSHVHDKRKYKGGQRNKESITAGHALSTDTCVNSFDLQINPFALQRNNGFVPNVLPLHPQNLQYSLNYLQPFNCMSFRREETPEKSVKSDNDNSRKWKKTKLGSIITASINNKHPGTFFSIMNYNVLAQDLLIQHPEVYRRHDKQALNWDFRWKNIMNEILEHNCDILCLQEVQESHISTHYNQLKTKGYEGIYKQATGIKTDGCAIYYRTNMFKLIEYISVEYMQPNTDILNRNNIALIAKFAPLNNLSAEFIIATTHLLYNPKREDVRLAQSQVLLTEVERMAFNSNKKGYLPIIITGDLNSTPDSTVYELFSSGSTDYTKVLKPQHSTVWVSPQLSITSNCQHANLLQYRQRNQKLNRDEEFKIIQLQHSEKNIVKENISNKLSENNSTGKIKHKFNFKSVYKNELNEGTTYQNAWVIVDYIFYSSKKFGNKLLDDNLVLLSYYTLPKGNALNSLIIPNHQLGSDHLSLIAKFKLEY